MFTLQFLTMEQGAIWNTRINTHGNV